MLQAAVANVARIARALGVRVGDSVVGEPGTSSETSDELTDA